MASSIASTLGLGSGIDTAALIEKLTTASKQPKEDAIKKREDLNTAQISSLGKVNSGIDTFASALSSLISGGTLFTQPTSSDSSVVSVAAVAGTRLGGLSAQLEVKKLAAAQVISSNAVVSDPNAAGLGTGWLKLTTSTGVKTIQVEAGSDSLANIAKAINSAQANVQASVVKDGANYRLVIKGATGAAEGFKLEASDDPAAPAIDPGLAKFVYAGTDGSDGSDGTDPSGFRKTQSAQDAQIVLDGLPLSRDTNTIKDLIPGVTISLKDAQPGKIISIGSERPTAAIQQAVGDFVAAYNELKATIDDAAKVGTPGADDAGPLSGDTAVRSLQRQLATLVSTQLTSSGTFKTLAEIGVSTNRDGTLQVDDTKLAQVLASNPDDVEALFNPVQTSSNPLVTITSAMGKAKPGTYQLTDLNPGPPPSGKIAGVQALVSGNTLIAAPSSAAAGLMISLSGAPTGATITVDAGLGGALQAIRDSLRASNGPLASTSTRLTNEKTRIADDRTAMEAQSTAYSDRLTQSFATMDTRVAAINATKSYLEQQIKAWNSDD